MIVETLCYKCVWCKDKMMISSFYPIRVRVRATLSTFFIRVVFSTSRILILKIVHCLFAELHHQWGEDEYLDPPRD